MTLDRGLSGPTNSQLQLMMDMPSVNFFSVDSKYRYTFFTSAHAQKMRELWGVDIAVDMDLLVDVIRDSYDRAKVKNSLYWALSGNDFTVTEACGKASTRRLFENRYTPAKTETGTVDGVSVCMTDVTERIQLANLQRALDQKLLESSNLASLGLMVGCINHDFNNILLPVLLNSELALKSLEPTHPATELIQEVILSVRCASALTKQLLSLGGAECVDKELVDLNEIVKSASELSRVAIGRRAELSKTFNTLPLRVSANVTQLRQVIVNLLTNASEASRGVPLKISVETSSICVTGPIPAKRVFTTTPLRGPYAVLTIQDNGTGMGPEQLDHIFQPFFSTKGNGRGLGLTAVQGIVNNHKGFLTIDSAQGVGSTFRVGLPVAHTAIESNILDDSSLLADEVVPFQPLRLLIVDDNPGSLKAISSVCSMLGHSVAIAASEPVALAAIITKQFDLVLLDGDMACQSSAKILDSIPDYVATPVVLTSSAVGQLGALLTNPRVHSVVMKPFSTSELVSALRRIQLQAAGTYEIPRGRGSSAASSH